MYLRHVILLCRLLFVCASPRPIFYNVTRTVKLPPGTNASHTRRVDVATTTIATDVALRITNHSCGENGLRIAPFQFIDADAPSDVLMHVNAPFLLMRIPEIVSRVGAVYVPVALARRLLHVRHDVSIVWTDNQQTVVYPTPEEETVLIQALWVQIEYDMYIHINPMHAFAFAGSECDIAKGSVSIVTVIVHEIIHGMGIYSVLRKEVAAGMTGYISIFDAGIKYEKCTQNCYVFDSTNIHTITGSYIAGTSIAHSGVGLHNPLEFVPGSSMSHIKNDSSIMAHRLSATRCKLNLSEYDVLVLNGLGWACQYKSTPFEWHMAYSHVASQSDDQTTGVWALYFLITMAFILLWCGVAYIWYTPLVTEGNVIITF